MHVYDMNLHLEWDLSTSLINDLYFFAKYIIHTKWCKKPVVAGVASNTWQYSGVKFLNGKKFESCVGVGLLLLSELKLYKGKIILEKK